MSDLLEDIARATALREGAAGVALVLRTIYRTQRITLRDLSRQTRLPLPVLAAVRRELERTRLVDRQAGLVLTPSGRGFVEQTLRVRTRHDAGCPTCHGHGIVIDEELASLVRRLELYSSELPQADVTLDQTPCTPQTAVRRALYMYQAGALEGKRIIFLGDDDAISVAVAMLGKTLGYRHLCRQLTVVETDRRFLRYIQDIARAEDVEIECFEHDLRQPLPESLLDYYDTFETDPPYTPDGLALFVSRAISAMKPGPGQQGFVSFGMQPPDAFLEVLRRVVTMGLVVQEVIPGFNDYRGASILAGTSQFLHVCTSRQTCPFYPSAWDGQGLYTGGRTPRIRRYCCGQCRTELLVGRGHEFQTVEDLQARGCPRCGCPRFHYKGRIVAEGPARQDG